MDAARLCWNISVPPSLFGDLHSLLEEVADDYANGEAQEEIKKTHPPDFNALIAGFPCQSVSRLNNKRKENLDAVRSKKGNTGNAWAGIKDILRMARRQGRTISFAVFEKCIGPGIPKSSPGSPRGRSAKWHSVIEPGSMHGRFA